MEIVYFESEKVDLISDNDEWKQRVAELGLEGQQKLFKEDKSPIPFKVMDAGLQRIYEILCPAKTDLESYDKDPIPLKVLSAIALARQEKYFGKIQIWYSPTDPDPVAVGFENNVPYLIGQWGPENISPEEMKIRAFAKWKEKSKAQLEACIEKCGSQLKTLDSLATEYFRGEWVNLSY